MRDFPGMQALRVLYENAVWGCSRCKLSSPELRYGSGWTEFPDVAFVLDPPTFAQERNRDPLAGETGAALREAIEASQRSGCKRLYYAYATCCRPKRPSDLSELELDACRPVVESQLYAVRPNAICCLGTRAAYSVLNEHAERGHESVSNRFAVSVHVTHSLRQVVEGTNTVKTEFFRDVDTVFRSTIQKRIEPASTID